MSLKDYFSLYPPKQSNFNATVNQVNPPKRPSQLVQWFSLLLGILVQPFFSYYKNKGSIDDWSLVYGDKFFMLFSVIVATVIFPSIYRAAFDTDRPKFVQMIPIFTAGLGWQTMVDSVVGDRAEGLIEPAAAMLRTVVDYSMVYLT